LSRVRRHARQKMAHWWPRLHRSANSPAFLETTRCINEAPIGMRVDSQNLQEDRGDRHEVEHAKSRRGGLTRCSPSRSSDQRRLGTTSTRSGSSNPLAGQDRLYLAL